MIIIIKIKPNNEHLIPTINIRASSTLKFQSSSVPQIQSHNPLHFFNGFHILFPPQQVIRPPVRLRPAAAFFVCSPKLAPRLRRLRHGGENRNRFPYGVVLRRARDPGRRFLSGGQVRLPEIGADSAPGRRAQMQRRRDGGRVHASARGVRHSLRPREARVVR